jgi:spore maturation protein CgeB
MRGLTDLGHDVRFFERDLPWYANNRDLPKLVHGRACIYQSLSQIKKLYEGDIRRADLVIVGSYVPEGIELGEWVTRTARGVTAFYDIDTPVTLAKLDGAGADYVSRRLIARYDLYLSFTGGPTLQRIEREYGAPMARPLYCSVDMDLYAPKECNAKWDLGYMGTYSEDRQPALERFLVEPARRCEKARMVVAGPQYPRSIRWPKNVQRKIHLSPEKHSRFYSSQRFTLNITRAAMRAAGYSPSVRLFEAAACGTAIVSDQWDGLDQFFRPGQQILIAHSTQDTLQFLHDIPDKERIAIGAAARARILKEHTSLHRGGELDMYVSEILGRSGGRASKSSPAASLVNCASAD